MARPHGLPRILVLAFALAAPPWAAGYEERVHQLIGERALPATMPRDLGRATPADVHQLPTPTRRAGPAHPARSRQPPG